MQFVRIQTADLDVNVKLHMSGMELHVSLVDTADTVLDIEKERLEKMIITYGKKCYFTAFLLHQL